MNYLRIELQKNITNSDVNSSSLLNALLQYYKIYGYDDFVFKYVDVIKDKLPNMIIICMGVDEDTVSVFLTKQNYKNVKKLYVKDKSDVKYVKSELKKLDGEYVTFLEPGNVFTDNKLSDSLLNLLTSPDDMVISYRNFLNDYDEEIKDDTFHYSGVLRNKSFCGNDLLALCEEVGMNFCGNLSSVTIDRNKFESIIEELDESLVLLQDNIAASLMRCMLKKCNVHFLNRAHILTKLKKNFSKNLEDECNSSVQTSRIYNVKKEITFIYTDDSEYYNLLPLAEKARERGYKIIFTMDIYQKAEIGVYCQHVCYPENAKFSVILLHDMAQGHNRWPNIWLVENWDKFDLGILPGKEWAERWSECAAVSYVRPRYGTYMLGYPKSDNLFMQSIVDKAKKIKEKLSYDFTVLYATSWENDNKEDDFIKAIYDLPINMVVKQAPVKNDGGVFQLHRDSVAAMRELHDGKYNNLTYIDVGENILVALSLCDLVVSDESSVMIEAALYGKPSIAVTDWLIPDTDPPRKASVPMDSVCKCVKHELRETVEKMMYNQSFYDKYKRLGSDFFANKGHCCDDIIDLIECKLYNGKINKRISELRLSPKYQFQML